jgi:hypothetical protein
MGTKTEGALTDAELQGMRVGLTMAKKVFALRARSGRPPAEIHISEKDLAVMLSAAYTMGAEDGRGPS